VCFLRCGIFWVCGRDKIIDTENKIFLKKSGVCFIEKFELSSSGIYNDRQGTALECGYLICGWE